MEPGIFLEISGILVIAAMVAGVAQLLRQPLIVGYILTGLLVGPLLHLVKSQDTAQLFAHIGIALLLFIVGLGLNPRVIRDVGKVALISALGQVALNTLLGFWLARLLGYGSTTALYIGLALAFSSTIIVLKMLSDKKELGRLHGKIATGFLLVQDLVASLVLVVVSSLSRHTTLGGALTSTILKGVVFGLLLTVLAIYVLPRLANFFAHSMEFLFVFAIGWGFGIAALCAIMGFSVEIGALAAGVALAASPYSYEISSRMRPLRDFFIILFFITLGASMTLGSVAGSLLPAIALSLFVLIINPLTVIVIMSLLGYTKKTSFMAGIAIAQISEFSLVLVLLAQELGKIPASVVTLVTLVGIITITASTYLVLYADRLYAFFERPLSFLERPQLKAERQTTEHHEVILFGFKGGSHNFLNAFKKLGKSYLVVDYDPETIELLRDQHVKYRYGDANDPEFLEELQLDKVKLVIVNLTDFEANRLILNHVRYNNQRAVVIAMTKSDKISNALELYEKGATYVMMPHYLGSTRISNIIRSHGLKAESFTSLRTRHTNYLLKHNI